MTEPEGRWAQLAFLSIAVLLVLGTWFSGTAVAASLSAEWDLDAVGIATLTVAVQLGFAAGAVGLAALGVPDVVSARWWPRFRMRDLPSLPTTSAAMWRLRQRPDAARMANGQR